ncbi:hypothetical protein ACJRO7_013478 [Eucalyptus globulus]|uniref:Uncharacterized protein n=1 Tax=Eucalyptus globulus TaxID=34317 RepID=A0ABD3KXR9_EUCGL
MSYAENWVEESSCEASSPSSLPRLPPTSLLLSSSSSVFLFNPSSLARTTKSANLHCHGSNSLLFELGRRRNQRVKRGLTCNALLGLGVPKLVVIAGITTLVFGPKKFLEVKKLGGLHCCFLARVYGQRLEPTHPRLDHPYETGCSQA